MDATKLTRADLVVDLARTIPIEQSLSSWLTHKTDQPVVWLVLRVISCKIWWLQYEGLEGPKWTRSMQGGLAIGDRESAYQLGRRVGGLLYLYDRKEV